MENCENQRKTGTTTVGLLCSDGVVLAADRKVTLGNLVDNAEFQKVYEIKPHIGMTTAGSVADAQRIIKIMKAEASLYEIQRGREMSVEAAATLLGNILQNNKFWPYFVGLTVGGIDTKPRLYSVDAMGSVVPQKIAFEGSGSPIALGVLEAGYKENQTVKENIPLAAKAVKAAQERDIYSGGKTLDVVAITRRGMKFLTEDEVKNLL
ncbi:MAG: archaeal proteasome endopeptidase complex subunit beta [archaeon]